MKVVARTLWKNLSVEWPLCGGFLYSFPRPDPTVCFHSLTNDVNPVFFLQILILYSVQHIYLNNPVRAFCCRPIFCHGYRIILIWIFVLILIIKLFVTTRFLWIIMPDNILIKVNFPIRNETPKGHSFCVYSNQTTRFLNETVVK